MNRFLALCTFVLLGMLLSGCDEKGDTYYYTVAPPPANTANPTPVVPVPADPDVIFKNTSSTVAQHVLPGQRSVTLASFRVYRKSANTQAGISQLVFDTGVKDLPPWMLFGSVQVKDAQGNPVSLYAYTKYSSEGYLIVDFSSNTWQPLGVGEYTIEDDLPSSAILGTAFQFKLVAVVLDEYGLEVSSDVVGPAFDIQNIAGLALPTVTSKSSSSWQRDLTIGDFVRLGTVEISCLNTTSSCVFEGLDAYPWNGSDAYVRTMKVTDGVTVSSNWIHGTQENEYTSKRSFEVNQVMSPGEVLSVDVYAYADQDAMGLEIIQVNVDVGGHKVMASPVITPGICGTILRSVEGSGCQGI